MKPNKSSIRLTQYRIKPQSGTALILQKGQIIRIIDSEIDLNPVNIDPRGDVIAVDARVVLGRE